MGTVTPPDEGEHKTPATTHIVRELVKMSKTYSKEYANQKISRYHSVLDEMRGISNEVQLESINNLLYFLRAASGLINGKPKEFSV